MSLSKKEMGNLIKQARLLKSKEIGKKYTQKLLGIDVGSSQSYMADIESGRTYPNYMLLNKIACACGVPFSFFGDLDEEIKNYIQIKYPDKNLTIDDDVVNHFRSTLNPNCDLSWVVDDYYKAIKYNNYTKSFNEWSSTTKDRTPQPVPDIKLKKIPVYKNLSYAYAISPLMYESLSPAHKLLDPEYLEIRNNKIDELSFPYDLDTDEIYKGHLVQDDSMNLSKIRKDDIIIFKEQREVENGHIAVVYIDDYKEFLIRRLYKTNTTITLIPNSSISTYEPITLDASKFQIIGKVVKAIINF